MDNTKQTPNIENLKLLRAFLAANIKRVQPRLNMATFMSVVDEFGDEEVLSPPLGEDVVGRVHDCGTTACVLGWSTLSGYPELGALAHEGWLGYMPRVFLAPGPTRPRRVGPGELASTSTTVLSFIFNPGWPDDLEQAIARIDYVVKHGSVPAQFENADWGRFDLRVDPEHLSIYWDEGD